MKPVKDEADKADKVDKVNEVVEEKPVVEDTQAPAADNTQPDAKGAVPQETEQTAPNNMAVNSASVAVPDDAGTPVKDLFKRLNLLK